MDRNLCWALVSFAVGLAAGYKDVYDRYETESLVASRTLPGLYYLVSRGALPAAVFVALYEMSLVASRLPLQALAIGTGAELFLKSSFLVKQQQRSSGTIDEILKGPLDLFRWYQDLFLVKLLPDYLARSRLEFVDENIPKESFDSLCDRVISNLDSLGTEDERRVHFPTEIESLRNDFSSHGTASGQEEKYRRKLGFLLLSRFGRNLLVTLLRPLP